MPKHRQNNNIQLEDLPNIGKAITSITATTPAGTVGAKDVVVTNPDTQTGT